MRDAIAPDAMLASDAIRAAHGPPGEADLADVAEHGALLGRFGSDLGELLDQIAVAGLAHPDPDLGEGIAALVDRARRLGLGAAAAGLAALAEAVDAVRAAAPPGALAPPALTRAAWDATQRLVAWRRLFERAVALQRVEGRLATEALVARGERPPKPALPTASARVWPLGLDLRDDRLTLVGLDVDTGGRVTVRDVVSEHDTDAPLDGTVISRLFQAAVSLRQVLGGLVVFEEHPVGRARGGPLFAPAFRAVPRRVAVSGPVAGPTLPRVGADGFDAIRDPMRADLIVERSPDGITFRLDDGTAEPPAVEVERTPTLELNALKRLVEAAGPGAPAVRASLPVVLGPAPGAPRVLSARDADDERVFPACDPRCFTLGPAALYRRALAATDAMVDDSADAIDGRFVRTVAALFGGASDAALDGLAEGWRGPQAGIDRLFRATLAGRLLRVTPDPALDAAVEAAIDEALLLGALPAADVPPADLAALLGRAPLRGEGLDGRAIWRALWLMSAGGAERARVRRGALLTLFAARYAGPLREPDPHDVAARALLLAELSREAAEGEEAEGEAPLGDDEVLAPARQFLDAHLADLRPAPGRPAPPLPGFGGLWALGEAHRLLYPEATPHGLAALGLPRPALARAVAAALLDLDRRPLRAADGLLCAAAAGVAHWLVG